uniref:Uncharacterized protein n=1 Tax=Parascaris equorum TaxID=6256 RepID=A0A914RY57_PAREQ
MDVADDGSVADAKNFVETKLAELGQELIAVVNNAGVRGTHMYDDFLTMQHYRSVWETNTFGTIRVTQAFKSLIKKSRYISASCTFLTLLRYGPYATSKAAVDAYADVIRRVLISKAFVNEFQQTSVSKDVKWVEDTYFQAIVGRYPKPLYRIGWDTILL